MGQKVLIVGSGGREHALAWKIAQSSSLGKLYIAPGNGGTFEIGENVAIAITDIKSLVKFAQKNKIDLTLVGPDDPLALGIVDVFRKKGLRIFGPTRKAAEIESSKAFAKKIMAATEVPTAPFRIFSEYRKALKFVRKHGAPIVIKASGLALGKGAYPCRTLKEAEKALSAIMLERVHKEAGNEVVVEEFLDGEELSIHVFCDGENFSLLPPARDHKRVWDGDRGKNTGGMGSIVPVPWVTAEIMKEIENRVVSPTLRELFRRSRPFRGLLFPGLKITNGELNVLEFNARFGDPETQSYMRLLKTDLLDIFDACLDGRLSEMKIEWRAGFAVCICLVSGGYPDSCQKGFPISGLKEAEQAQNVVIFHAGTDFNPKTKEFITAGGRVLGVTATHKTLRGALNRAYEAARLIKFKDMHYRKDIGTHFTDT